MTGCKLGFMGDASNNERELEMATQNQSKALGLDATRELVKKFGKRGIDEKSISQLASDGVSLRRQFRIIADGVEYRGGNTLAETQARVAQNPWGAEIVKIERAIIVAGTIMGLHRRAGIDLPMNAKTPSRTGIHLPIKGGVA